MSLVEKKLRQYMARAISQYNMIQDGDRVLVCLSGGKDSYTMLNLLHQLRVRSGRKFELFSLTLDQAQPGWDDSGLKQWLENKEYSYEVLHRDTYSVVMDKVPEGKTYCSLCSRLRRGNIYTYAKKHGFTKIALGHHRDDLIESTMMGLLYSGEIRSMPPKLITDDKHHIVIRPMVLCKEKDIITYAKEQEFPIIPCNLCGSQENLTRKKVKLMIQGLADDNSKVPANMLHAISNIRKSQLMDPELWDFNHLEDQLLEITDEVRNRQIDDMQHEPFDSGFSVPVPDVETPVETSGVTSVVKLFPAGGLK